MSFDKLFMKTQFSLQCEFQSLPYRPSNFKYLEKALIKMLVRPKQENTVPVKLPVVGICFLFKFPNFIRSRMRLCFIIALFVFLVGGSYCLLSIGQIIPKISRNIFF